MKTFVPLLGSFKGTRMYSYIPYKEPNGIGFKRIKVEAYTPYEKEYFETIKGLDRTNPNHLEQIRQAHEKLFAAQELAR